MTSQSNLATLQTPAKLDTTLSAQQRDYDCTPCRLMGSAAFTGLGVYSYWSGMSQLKQQEIAILKSGSMFGMGPRKGAIFALSATLVGMGFYRFKY